MTKKTKLTVPEALTKPTISVKEAGELFLGLGGTAVYEAVKRGDIPTVRIGGSIRVPVAPLAKMLGLEHHIVEAAR